MRIIVSGYSKEGHAYLISLPTDRLVRRTEFLLSRDRNKAIKSILAHGQLEDVFPPSAIAYIDADMIVTRKRVSRTIMHRK